jgi:hypothetical protein
MNEAFISRSAGKKIVLPFFLLGAFFLLLFTGGLFVCSGELSGHYFHPHLLALVHVLVLGFCTMIVFGALYQLLPVLSERPLFSKRLTGWCCILLASGTVLLGYAFWIFNSGVIMQVAGFIILTAVILHIINVLLSLKGAKSSITFDCIATAHLWLLLTVIVGLLLVFNFQFAFLPQDQLHYLTLHAHLGLVGWLILLIIGVGSKLIPMFLLSGSDQSKLIRFSYYMINSALVLFFADVLFTHSYARAWCYVIITCAGLCGFALMIARAKKKSVRKKADESMKQTFIAFFFLLLPALLALALSSPGNMFDEKQLLALARVYGIALIPGFLVMLILALTFKTLPFILWIDLKHKGPMPPKFMPRDLYNPRSVMIMLWSWNAGIAALIAGNTIDLIWMNYVGSGIMSLAALLYLFNILFMLTNKKALTENEKRSL